MKTTRSNQRTNVVTGAWMPLTLTRRLIMNSLTFLNTYPSIILAVLVLSPVLVLIVSGQQAGTHGQTPEPKATPRITPGEFVDALNGAFGKQTTNRATHAKGIVLLGTFTPTSQAVGLSKAAHFKQAVAITVRFSDNTGIPTLADAAPQARPHGMAIKFHLPDGTDTDLVAHSLNGFPAKTPEDMRQFIMAATASGPGVAAPTPIQKYLEAHPEAKPFATAPGPAPVSYGTIAYFGVNTFKFIAADGKATFGRYQIIPETGKQFLSKDDAVNASHDYLLDEIRTRVAKGPVRFKFVLQLPVPGDKLDDPSIPWSDTNKTSELGTIEITSIVPESDATQRALPFLPSLLPDGIEPADPMIRFRGLAYPVSYDRRHQ
jgi:catalase